MSSDVPAKSYACDICFLSSAHPALDKRVFEREARTLADAGYRVVHIAPVQAGEAIGDETLHNVRIIRYQRQDGLFRRAFRGIPKMILLVRRQNAAALHCNEVDSWIAGILGSMFTPTRVVFDVHEHYPSTFAAVHGKRRYGGIRDLLVRGVLSVGSRFTDGFVFAKEGLSDDYRLGRADAITVRNLPPLRLERGLRDNRSAAGKGVEVIHSGLINRARGWPVLAEALAKPGLGEVRLRVLGKFAGDEEREFAEYCERLGIVERVVIEPWLPFDVAFERVAAADIGIVLFQKGIRNHVYAAPHKLYEYMLAGLPVVVPDVALEVASVVRRFKCGLVVDSGEADDVAAAIQSLAEDQKLRENMGERGRAAIRSDLNWDSEARKLVEFYSRVVGSDVG